MEPGYEISVQDVQRIVTSLEVLLSDFRSGAGDLSRLTLPTGSFGQVGGAAAQATTTAHDQLTATLEALAKVLAQLNRRIGASATGYQATDRNVAAALAAMTAARSAR